MRFIFGIVVGIALTIGVAYVHDLGYAQTITVPAPGEPVAAKPFVNWDSVGVNARAAAAAIREQWDKLTGK